jgi:hypothetical protein
MRVRQKGLRASHSVAWQLIPLDEVIVKRVQDENEVKLGGVRKVRPVESIGHVHLVRAAAEMSARPLLVIQTRLQVDCIKIEVVTLVHENEHLSFPFLIIDHLYFSIKHLELLGLHTPHYLCFESQTIGALDVTISIIFLRHHKVKLLLVVGTVPDGFVPQLWKEVLALAFQNVVFVLVGEHHLLGVVGDFYLDLGTVLLEQNDSFVDVFVVVNIIDLDDFAATVLFAGDRAVLDFALGILGIDDHIKDFFVIFADDEFWNVFSFFLAGEMSEEDLNFGHDGDESLLVIKNYFLNVVECRVIEVK